MGRRDIAAATLAARGVGHGVGLVKDDHAIKTMAAFLLQSPREPGDDLLQPGAFALAGRGSQCGVGGKQYAGLLGNLLALAEPAQGNHIVRETAEGGPVAAGVLQQLVGLGQPQGSLPAAQPIVQHHGGDLAALARAGAVAEHPAPAEPHRGGKQLALGRDGGRIAGILVRAATQHGLAARADAVGRGKMLCMGGAGQRDAFELGVGKQTFGHHAFWQQGPVGRRGMRHRGHGGGLDQRGRVGNDTVYANHAGLPAHPGAASRLAGGIRRAGVAGSAGNTRNASGLRRAGPVRRRAGGAYGQLLHPAPIPGLRPVRRGGFRGGDPGGRLRPAFLRRGNPAKQVGRRRGFGG